MAKSCFTNYVFLVINHKCCCHILTFLCKVLEIIYSSNNLYLQSSKNTTPNRAIYFSHVTVQWAGKLTNKPFMLCWSSTTAKQNISYWISNKNIYITFSCLFNQYLCSGNICLERKKTFRESNFFLEKLWTFLPFSFHFLDWFGILVSPWES